MMRLISFTFTILCLASCLPSGINIKGASNAATSETRETYLYHFGASTAAANGFAGVDISYTLSTVVDSFRNTYVIGGTSGDFVTGESSGADSDIFVAKISENGTIIWKRQFGALSVGVTASSSEAGLGGKIDSDGNLVIFAVTQGSLLESAVDALGDLVLIKMNTSTGATIWQKQLGSVSDDALPGAPGFSSAGEELYFQMTLDSSDNIYVHGMTKGHLADTNADPGSKFDPVIIKYDTNGNFLKAFQLGVNFSTANAGTDFSNDQWSAGIEVDSSGNIYIAGATTTVAESGAVVGGNLDVYTMKLDSNGNMIWTQQLTSADGLINDHSGSELPNQVKLDSNNNLYLVYATTGDFVETNAGATDLGFAKFNGSTGAIEWIKQVGATTAASLGVDASSYDYSGMRWAFGIFPFGNVEWGSNGNLYFVGQSTNYKSLDGYEDILIGSISKSGSFSFLSQITSLTMINGSVQLTPANTEVACSIHIDDLGYIYITGKVDGDFTETLNGASYDFFMLRTNPNGTL